MKDKNILEISSKNIYDHAQVLQQKLKIATEALKEIEHIFYDEYFKMRKKLIEQLKRWLQEQWLILKSNINSLGGRKILKNSQKHTTICEKYKYIT